MDMEVKPALPWDVYRDMLYKPSPLTLLWVPSSLRQHTPFFAALDHQPSSKMRSQLFYLQLTALFSFLAHGLPSVMIQPELVTALETLKHRPSHPSSNLHLPDRRGTPRMYFPYLRRELIFC